MPNYDHIDKLRTAIDDSGLTSIQKTYAGLMLDIIRHTDATHEEYDLALSRLDKMVEDIRRTEVKDRSEHESGRAEA